MWFVNPNKVLSETLDGEAVIIDLASGRYHAASGVAATVWEGMRRGSSFDDIINDVRRAHSGLPNDAEQSVQAFIDEVVNSGLAVSSDVVAPASDDGAPAAAESTPWSVPVLESHDDLADLMLIDPVHDVSELGWPHTRPATG